MVQQCIMRLFPLNEEGFFLLPDGKLWILEEIKHINFMQIVTLIDNVEGFVYGYDYNCESRLLGSFRLGKKGQWIVTKEVK